MVELPMSHHEIAEDRGIDLLPTLEGPVRRSGTEISSGVEGHVDQAHEQNNAAIKGDGGAVGLIDKPSALRRWMVAGPEVARLIEEFREQLSRRTDHKTQSIMTSQRVCRPLSSKT